eukprot:scaffold11258_cov44-Attheya_sp.AAC.2
MHPPSTAKVFRQCNRSLRLATIHKNLQTGRAFFECEKMARRGKSNNLANLAAFGLFVLQHRRTVRRRSMMVDEDSIQACR